MSYAHLNAFLGQDNIFFCRCPRAALSCAYSREEPRFHMPQTKPTGKMFTTPADAALALKVVSESDLLRLKTIARIYARGLPADVGWADLLQEAFARVLDGSRQRPEGISLVVFLAGIMRSLKSEHWRRALRESRRSQTVLPYQEPGGPEDRELPDPAPDPERVLIALQELAAIDKLFAGDRAALLIINGLGAGLSAEQIRIATGISKTDYDSARKRMRRTLLREGLTCRLR
jgi:DNA-directed RNA polymerase specialized sigma24 family protein